MGPGPSDNSQELKPYLRSHDARRFENALRGKIVGQDEAVAAVVNLYEVFRVGLNPPHRPLGNLLFLGPTGAGKTHLIEATADVLLGSPRSMIKIDCAEFQHSHEIAKLIGAPPGYTGHDETEPLITPESLARCHTDELQISLLLFDEIEKGSDALWQLLLEVLDKGMLTLGDNRRVDFSQAMIFMTSNLGGSEITTLADEKIGFSPGILTRSRACLFDKIENVAINAAKRKFAPEFINRLDKVVVFRPLQREQLERILQIELDLLQQRIARAAKGRFLLQLTPAAKAFVLEEGTNHVYGARHLRRAIERHLVIPVANFLATKQVSAGAEILVDRHHRNHGLTFLGQSRTSSVNLCH